MGDLAECKESAERKETVILYFSATGNCKYVAERLAEALGEEALPMVECIRTGRYDFAGETIGIIAPTYDWGLPSLVKEFLEKATLRAEYLYYIATYGTTPGASGCMAQKALRGQRIDAFYAIRMADTWTPVFDLSTPEKVAVFTRTTEQEIDRTIQRVAAREHNRKMTPRTPVFLTEWFAEPIYNSCVRKTSHLRVEESCIGCGLCERKCPVQAIKMEEKRPAWVRERCAMCLGCLHRCPKFAIQYGNRTKRHGQYTNPHVKL